MVRPTLSDPNVMLGGPRHLQAAWTVCKKKITTALVVGGKGPVAPADGTRVYSCKYFDSEYVFDFF
jgi:hypothetical protein